MSADNQKLSAKRREGSPRETAEVATATARLIRAVGRRIALEDPEHIRLLTLIQEHVDYAWTDAIQGLRQTGFTDGEIAAELGTTKQAVQKRWPR